MYQLGYSLVLTALRIKKNNRDVSFFFYEVIVNNLTDVNWNQWKL